MKDTLIRSLRKWIPLAMMTIASLSVLAWVGIARITRKGDAREYYFQTYQFAHKFELSGTKEDLSCFAEWFKPVEVLNFDKKIIPEYPRGNGFTRVGDRCFAHHFGFYSILAAGPSIALRALSLDDHRALLLTNGLLFVAMLWSVWFLLPYRWSTKMAVEICLICSPAALYLTWAHTEVYLFVFLMMSLAAAVAGRWRLSLLFASIASMQNQTLGVYLFTLVLLFLGREFAWWQENRGIRWREWGGTFLAGLPSLIPVVYYMIHLHRPSLLGGMDAASTSFMSILRTWSLFTDLNQGVFAASSALVVLFFAFLIFRIVTGRSEQTWIAVVALLTGYAVTSIINWNSGCYGVMRYAAWIYAFIVIFAFANLDKVGNALARIGISTIVVFVTVGQFYFLPKGYLKLREVSCFIWNRAPALYSPEPDIFTSRVTGREHTTLAMRDDDIYCMYYDKMGDVRKVLATYDGFVKNRYRYDVTDDRQFEVLVKGARRKPSRLRYFNFPKGVLRVPPLRSGQIVSFGKESPSVIIGDGFYGREAFGVWSMSKRCDFGVMLPMSSAPLRLVVRAYAYMRTRHVDVFSNEQKLASWEVKTPPLKAADYTVEIPAALTGRMLRLRLEQDAVACPREFVPGSLDTRTLGMGLISLSLVAESKK